MGRPAARARFLLSAVFAAAAAASAGCGNMVVLRPPVLPHAYDTNADLGTLAIAPVRDERPFPPILDRNAMRRHGCIEGRDLRRVTVFEDGISQTWLREPQFLAAPLVETLEQSLAAESAASNRFRGGAGKPKYELSFRLEELYVQVVLREEADAGSVTGALLPLAAGFIPVAGMGVAVSMAAAQSSTSAQVDCELSGVAVLSRGGTDVFVKRVEVKLKEKGMGMMEGRIIGRVMETAVSRAAHLAVAESCRFLDGAAAAPEQPNARPREDSK